MGSIKQVCREMHPAPHDSWDGGRAAQELLGNPVSHHEMWLDPLSHGVFVTNPFYSFGTIKVGREHASTSTPFKQQRKGKGSRKKLRWSSCNKTEHRRRKSHRIKTWCPNQQNNNQTLLYYPIKHQLQVGGPSLHPKHMSETLSAVFVLIFQEKPKERY